LRKSLPSFPPLWSKMMSSLANLALAQWSSRGLPLEITDASCGRQRLLPRLHKSCCYPKRMRSRNFHNFSVHGLQYQDQVKVRRFDSISGAFRLGLISSECGCCSRKGVIVCKKRGSGNSRFCDVWRKSPLVCHTEGLALSGGGIDRTRLMSLLPLWPFSFGRFSLAFSLWPFLFSIVCTLPQTCPRCALPRRAVSSYLTVRFPDTAKVFESLPRLAQTRPLLKIT
jgi:hypothetical protein